MSYFVMPSWLISFSRLITSVGEERERERETDRQTDRQTEVFFCYRLLVILFFLF